jgi:predicted CXXCH cytochrome family protein
VARWGVMIALATLAVTSCVDSAGDGGQGPAEASYVGRESCASCHEAEARLWSGSDHDRAMQEATDETVLGDFDDATFTYRGVTSTFFRRSGGFFVRTDGPSGELTEYPIAYTFGVRPLQQYLVPFPGGRYQALSIAWDARPAEVGGQRWFHLYPDAAIDAGSPLHWTRPAQNWNTVCAECHSTGLDKGFDVESLSYETSWSEIDVSCEACHGPGSRHVALAEKDAAAAALRMPPDSAGQIEACAPCHSRRTTLAEGYVPGDTLEDFYQVSLLREGLYHPDGQIDDEVYVYGSFVQSRMYASGVNCSDCHDPHTLKTRAEGNALCTRCHDAGRYDAPSHSFHEPSSEGSACVECHMPSKSYMVVDPRRDHSLRVPRPDLSVEIGVPNACNRCHADRSAEWAAEAVTRWYGPREGPPHYGVAIAGGRAGDPVAVVGLTALARDTARPEIARATALTLLGSYARTSTVGALAASLRDPEPILRYGALEGLTGRSAATVLKLAYPLLDDPVRAVRIEAARRLAAVPRELTTPAQAAAITRGTEEYEQAQRVNRDHPSAWVNLGDLDAMRGRAAEAEAAFRTALAIDSTDLVAHLNLADLQRAIGRDDLTEEMLFGALAVDPGTPEILHAIGLLRVRQGDLAGALDWLERAAAGRPENARFAYVYGVALASAGDTARGVRVLEESLGAHPYDRGILAALAAYARDLGEVETAIGYAERLVKVVPEDPGARDLLSSLKDSGG